MSQIPPGQSDGWIDPHGQLQPGFPPPGYWQASDGRWYPPDLASADTQTVGPPTQQPFTPPAAAPADASPSPGYPQPGSPHGGPPGHGQVPASAGFEAPSAPPSYDYASPTQRQYGPPGAGGPPGPYGAPAVGYPPASAPKKNRAGLYVVIGLVALAVAGCAGIGIVAVARSENSQTATEQFVTTTTEQQPADTSADTPTTAGNDDDNNTTETTAAALAGVTTAPGAGQIGDGSGCEIIDDTTIRVELVNESAVVQSFFLTVGFFDDSTRLGDTVAIVGHLRPGERTIEDTFYFDQAGSRCEILEVDGFEVSYDQAFLADASSCEITGADTFGDIRAELSVTNSTAQTVDYSVQLAFVDAEGIRRGTGFATIESVRAGETAPSDVFSVIEADDALTCEIVGVDRTPS